eukprot:Seg15250.1 transcript_id=Seg15250.1/GoldUCD/mRNA.D3Y31 product="hypothetical protein" protein_id=Seg15250.1/GoldUCD/D3Y31
MCVLVMIFLQWGKAADVIWGSSMEEFVADASENVFIAKVIKHESFYTTEDLKGKKLTAEEFFDWAHKADKPDDEDDSAPGLGEEYFNKLSKSAWHTHATIEVTEVLKGGEKVGKRFDLKLVDMPFVSCPHQETRAVGSDKPRMWYTQGSNNLRVIPMASGANIRSHISKFVINKNPKISKVELSNGDAIEYVDINTLPISPKDKWPKSVTYVENMPVYIKPIQVWENPEEYFAIFKNMNNGRFSLYRTLEKGEDITELVSGYDKREKIEVMMSGKGSYWIVNQDVKSKDGGSSIISIVSHEPDSFAESGIVKNSRQWDVRNVFKLKNGSVKILGRKRGDLNLIVRSTELSGLSKTTSRIYEVSQEGVTVLGVVK